MIFLSTKMVASKSRRKTDKLWVWGRKMV